MQLVPEGQGGVRDCMDRLAAQWSRLGVPNASLALSRESVRVRALHARLSDVVAAASPPQSPRCTVLLHFSGYGYAPRGLCDWLLDELISARAILGERMRLAVVFHELFASGPPWRSAFWVSPLQARIAARLARMSDVLWTNTGHHAEWLREAAGPRKPVHVRPVFSNIGEPEHVPDLAARQPRAVVFGSPSTRRRAFEALRGRAALLRHLGIDELIEVGNGDPIGAPGIACRHAGALPADAVGQLLQESRFGLIDYAPMHLGKSGVFAAYAAHGCVALNTAAGSPVADGLRHAEHYLTLGGDMHACDAQRVSQTARRWYAGHAQARQAADMLAAMAGDAAL